MFVLKIRSSKKRDIFRSLFFVASLLCGCAVPEIGMMKFFLFAITTILFECSGACLSTVCDNEDCMASPLNVKKENTNETCTKVPKIATRSLDLKGKFPEDLRVKEENARNNKLELLNNEKFYKKNLEKLMDNLKVRRKSYGSNPAAKLNQTKPVFNVSIPYVVFCILTGGLAGWVLIEWFDDPEDDDEDEFNTAPDVDENIRSSAPIRCSIKPKDSSDTFNNKLELTDSTVTFRSNTSSTTGNVKFEDAEEDVNC